MLPGPAGRIGRHAPTCSRIRRFAAESTPLAQSQPGEKGTMHTHSHTKTQDRDQDQTQLDPFGRCDAHQLPPTSSIPGPLVHWPAHCPTLPRIHASRYPRRSYYPPAFSQILSLPRRFVPRTCPVATSPGTTHPLARPNQRHLGRRHHLQFTTPKVGDLATRANLQRRGVVPVCKSARWLGSNQAGDNSATQCQEMQRMGCKVSASR
ncbi:hypothetical protein EDB80DRAFT_15227 [Ilyonectria destructans]|nr:hypothetical protein EDB80DRAFT_15227 [Ilyonectria destructans]